MEEKEEEEDSEDDDIPRLDPRMVEEEANREFWNELDEDAAIEAQAESGPIAAEGMVAGGGTVIEDEVGAPLFEEEGRPARVRRAPREPSKKEREEHEATHVP